MVANLIAGLKETDVDDGKPNVDETIRAVCMMTLSQIEREAAVRLPQVILEE